MINFKSQNMLKKLRGIKTIKFFLAIYYKFYKALAFLEWLPNK